MDDSIIANISNDSVEDVSPKRADYNKLCVWAFREMKGIKAIPFNIDAHYEDICDWWERWEFGAIPLWGLSTTGIVIRNDDMLLAAGWLYGTDSGFCLIEHLVANPDISPRQRHVAVELVYSLLEKTAQDSGYMAAITMTDNRGLTRRLENRNYHNKCSNASFLIKGMNNG